MDKPISPKTSYVVPAVLVLTLVVAWVLFPARMQAFFAALKSF